MHIQRTGNAAEQHYPNIRGWLLLVAVGVILLPLRLVGILVEDLLPAFSKEGWALLTTPGAAFYHRLNAPTLSLGGNSLLLVGSLILAVEFFRKRKRVPLMIVVLLLFALLFYVGDYFAAHLLAAVASQSETEPVLDLVVAVLVCAILVWYFLVSKRVKGTFVH
ncbi:MAG: hypothetical protein AUH21_02705 [Nitrospirae bacterium 13_2_20CM_62_7]|nr:MAG: hypothetical protein AUH21_02705 [Nitrospirae bacterium 13_2_20CM_62_7]